MMIRRFIAILLVVALITPAVIAGVKFAGAMWYYSEDPNGLLFVNSQGKLQWRPKRRQQLTVRIPELRMSEIGDLVEFSVNWKSDGESGCDCANLKDFHGEFCNDDSIDCLAGTGDFRMGLYDSNGMGYVNKDGLGTKPKVFAGYLGYAWRFFPHLSEKTVRRVFEYKGENERESHTNMSFWERTKPQKSAILSTTSSYKRLGQPLAGGFALGLGVEGVLKLRLHRISKSSVQMTIELNGHKYERTDETRLYQPEKIDVFAIQFPNGRPYNYIIFDNLKTKSTNHRR